MFQSYLVLVVLLVIGVNNCKSQDRMISYGKPAREGQFPYQAQFSVVYEGEEHHYCGGALISDQWILSAAHCYPEFLKDHYMQVYLGSIRSKDINATRIRIDDFFKHPNYTDIKSPTDIQNMTSDIMLVKLKTPVRFTELVYPIALPDKNLAPDYFVGKELVVSGFGDTESDKPSDELRYVKLSVMSSEDCGKIDEEDPFNNEYICTKADQSWENPCSGDSGGPLVGTVSTKPTLIGIVSSAYAFSCGFLPNWAKYTRVSVFLDWIKETMAKN